MKNSDVPRFIQNFRVKQGGGVLPGPGVPEQIDFAQLQGKAKLSSGAYMNNAFARAILKALHFVEGDDGVFHKAVE